MKRRNTQSKSEILAVLKDSYGAMSHDMIQAEIESEIDRTTIYRILNSFCEDGVIHRVVGDDGKQYFAMCVEHCEHDKEHTHDHLHFRCTSCGKVECLPSKVHFDLPRGYSQKSFNAVVSGICAECD